MVWVFYYNVKNMFQNEYHVQGWCSLLFTSNSLLVTSTHATTNRNGALMVTTVQALSHFLPSESEMKLVAT
jgi:hypothetical protein